jgi:large subunit ribosomal protein L1
LKKTSKRFTEIKSKTQDQTFQLTDAIKLLKECANAKFDEAIEFHIKTSADPKHADQQIRETSDLPNGTGKKVRIMLFAEGESGTAAKDAGAEYLIDDNMMKKIEEGWDDFDIAIATPEMMPKIAKLGKHLGRKGLMPNPRSGTVVQEDKLIEAVEKANKGRVEIRMDKDANIHTRIGLCSFTEDQIFENMASIYSTIQNNKPEGVKGSLIDSASICSTMGPGINLDLDNLRESLVK